MELESTKGLLEIGGIVFTAVSTLIAFTKKFLINPVNKFKKDFYESDERKIQTLYEHSLLLKELQFNGGSSVKDVVNKISTKLDGFSKDLDRGLAMIQANLEVETDGIFIADEKGSCKYVNKAYLEITGLTFHEALNYGWINAIYDKDLERIKGAWKNTVDNKSNATHILKYKNIKSKEIIKCSVAWHVQTKQGDISETTILILGRVTPIIEEK